ncbi:polysaccharide lyase [Xylaria bambusicola]|uniref:polysaccharide lyase n=1 Tax=Xylaria bambusicola TaxID=326684 RepID=UPI0020079AF3|nr:polysaccharide lyase [Xylaria bambusicola]KAI0506091.1 polysaccharide lyase [Xylaria bambusicola]
MLSHTLTHLLYALGAAAAVQATQIFSNTGTMSGWDAYTRENKGTVQEVTNVAYKGSTALKMTQVYDSTWNGRYHSEAVKYNVYKKGDTGFYGFAFRLQENWQFSPAQNYNLAQFIADFTDLGCEETYMPSTMVWIEGDQLATRVKYGNVCPTNQQITRSFKNLKTVTPGVWHRIELQVSWKSDNTGYFKMWYDGEKVTETYDIPTNVGDGRPFQFRVGLYANGWHDSGYQGTQPTRQVWYDQIAAGSVFADANPDGW